MAQPFPFELGKFGGSLEMSNFGQAPRCQFCNSEMRLRISKTVRTRGRRFWKCTRSYVRTLYCAGFIWDDEPIRFNQGSRENEAVRGADEEEYKDEQGEYEEEM
ncbi:unnamed protein product [Prunus brigantina]